MTLLEPAAEGPGAPADDLLTEVELKIARRADEFARLLPSRSMLNLQCWLLAEAELLGRDSAQARSAFHAGR